MKKVGILLLVLMLVGSVFTGCADSAATESEAAAPAETKVAPAEEAASDSAEIAIVLKTLSNPFWVAMKDGIEAEAEALGVTVEVFAVSSEDDTQGQLRLFENLLNKDYKAIGFAPLSPVNLVQPAAQAYQQGIFLMNIDEKIDMTELKNAGGNVLAFATTDNVKVGENGAGYIVENLQAGDQVAIVEGKAGNASGEARRQGAENAFTAANLEIVASQPADWDRTKALDLAANLIQRYPDLKGIYCANDTMALGVQQAVVNAGLEDTIMVVGTDGAPEAIESVKNGELAATVAQDPGEIGAASLRVLVEAMNGERAQIGLDEEPEFIAIGSQLITE